MSLPPQPPENVDSGINIFDFIDILLKQAVLIIALTILGLIFGVIYTLTAPEKWIFKVGLALPERASVEALNKSELAVLRHPVSDLRSMNAEQSAWPVYLGRELTSEEVIAEFVSKVRSVEMLLEFDATYDHNLFGFSAAPTNDQRYTAAQSFLNSQLKVITSDNNAGSYEIELTLDTPDHGKRILDEYLRFVNARFIENRRDELRSVVRRSIRANDLAIKRLERTNAYVLEAELARLKEALEIAQATDIKDVQSCLMGLGTVHDFNGPVDTYLNGERVLEAKIMVLRTRIKSEISSPEIGDLQTVNAILSDIEIDTSEAMAYKIGYPPVVIPAGVAPRMPLILSLSLALGFMLGIVVALVRFGIRNRQARLID